MRESGRAMIRGVATVVAALTLGVITAGPAGAAVVLEEYFTGAAPGYQGMIVDTPHGKGWRATAIGDDLTQAQYFRYDNPAGILNPAAGTIEMEIIRGEQERMEGLFYLVDGQGRTHVGVHIRWERTRSGEPEIAVGYSRSRREAWYAEDRDQPGVHRSYFPIGKVARGQRLHLAFSWGPSSANNAIWVNGRKLSVKADTPSGMTAAIKAAKFLAVGGEPIPKNPDGAYIHLNSTLEYFRVHDLPVSGATLRADASRYLSSTGALAVNTLSHDAARVAGFSGKMVAGDVMTVNLEGTPGQEAFFDVARLADSRGEIPVSWEGWGVYLEDITFFDDDQVDLRDVEEYRVYVSRSPIGEITLETEPVETLEVEQQSYTVDSASVLDENGESYSLELLEFDTPYYIAVMALMDDDRLLPVIEPVQGIAMGEVEDAPGSYEGTYTVDYRDRYPEAVVVGRLRSGPSRSVLAGEETFEVDPSLNIEVAASVEELKADEKSTSEITVSVTDANGEGVSDHEVRFVLATTSRYTGVVGGGAFADEVGGTLDRNFWGETDLFGRVKATYTAGFAAKTAIVVARDMLSNDTGVGYVKTFINATAQLELEAVQQTAGKALGYTITVTSSDEWLTADGESEARITAFVAQDGIPVEGHRVGFTVSAGSGRIRTVRGETNANGKALAVYTAGRKIGVVLIRATDHSVPGLTGTVQIELRSDAPAKIAITLTPDLLPADGRSTADIEVVVTDINDNPNEGIEVEYEVEIGSGRLRNIDEVTDRRGESAAEYVAGRMPGKVSIKVTVRSTLPTEEEMAEARALATAVTDYDFF